MARQSIAEKRIAECANCNDPIIPGDFVAVEASCSDVTHQRLVHAGFHFTLNERDAFCETGAVGVGYWDGTQVLYTGESLAAKALRTGEVQMLSAQESKAVVTKAERDVITPEGLGVVVSVGSDESKEPDSFFDAPVSFEELSEANIQFLKCGHDGSQKAKINLWGSEFEFEVKNEKIEGIGGVRTVDSLCPRCQFEVFQKASIRCCLCGRGITPGAAVALYHKSSGGINKKVATYVGNSVVGCLGWNCCPSGGFFAGHWTDEGFKSAFSEGETAVEEAFNTGKIVISNP